MTKSLIFTFCEIINDHKERGSKSTNLEENFSNLLEEVYKFQNPLEVNQLLQKNTLPIIENFAKHDNFLIAGDVQSGKTLNIIKLISYLHARNKTNFIIYLSGSKNNTLKQNDERLHESLNFLFGEEVYVLQSPKNVEEHADKINKILQENKTIVYTMIKQKNRLEQVKELVERISNKIILKLVFVDDECDDTSLGKKIFEFISRIKVITNFKYFSLSATPFKNLLANKQKFTYFKFLESGKNYFGLEEFLKKEKSYVNFDSIISINSMKYKVLEEVFLRWVVNFTKAKAQNSQLLINCSSKTSDHKDIKRKFNGMLKKLNESLKENEDNLTIKFEEYAIELDSREFVEIMQFIKSFQYQQIFIDNSLNFEERQMPKNEDFKVIIGGYNLSRGQTFPNMHAMLFLTLNDPKTKPSASTILQRARWLGYKNKTLATNMTIFTNSVVLNSYYEILEVVNYLKNEQNEPLKDFQSWVKNKNFHCIIF